MNEFEVYCERLMNVDVDFGVHTKKQLNLVPNLINNRKARLKLLIKIDAPEVFVKREREMILEIERDLPRSFLCEQKAEIFRRLAKLIEKSVKFRKLVLLRDTPQFSLATSDILAHEREAIANLALRSILSNALKSALCEEEEDVEVEDEGDEDKKEDDVDEDEEEDDEDEEGEDVENDEKIIELHARVEKYGALYLGLDPHNIRHE